MTYYNYDKEALKDRICGVSYVCCVSSRPAPPRHVATMRRHVSRSCSTALSVGGSFVFTLRTSFQASASGPTSRAPGWERAGPANVQKLSKTQ